MSRRSYRGLMALAAWLLYDGDELVASVRAGDADQARALFRGAGLTGTHMRRAERASLVDSEHGRDERRLVRPDRDDP